MTMIWILAVNKPGKRWIHQLIYTFGPVLAPEGMIHRLQIRPPRSTSESVLLEKTRLFSLTLKKEHQKARSHTTRQILQAGDMDHPDLKLIHLLLLQTTTGVNFDSEMAEELTGRPENKVSYQLLAEAM